MVTAKRYSKEHQTVTIRRGHDPQFTLTFEEIREMLKVIDGIEEERICADYTSLKNH